MQDGNGIFFRLMPTPVWGFTAQPLLKTPYSKAFRYAAILQRLDKHTLLSVWYYHYIVRGELCQENPQFSQLSTNLIRHESIETSRIHLTKSTEEQRDTLRLLDLCEQIRRQVSGIVILKTMY